MGENSQLLAIMELCGHFLYHRRGGKRGQAKILRLLHERGTMTQKEIQDIIDIKSGSLSEIVHKMEADNLIERKKNENDKRNIIINMTQKGMELAQENDRHLKEQEEIMFNCLTKEEQKLLYDLLSKLIGNWKENFEASLFNHRRRS